MTDLVERLRRLSAACLEGLWQGNILQNEDGCRRNSAQAMTEAAAEIERLRADAARYAWLKSRKGLYLRSEPQPNVWKRLDGSKFSATHSLAEGNTRHAPADSLDATIDAAMRVAAMKGTP